MDTITTLRLFSDGRMSAHDTRALMLSMGHTREEFAEAFTELAEEEGSRIRIGGYQSGELQAELYLTAVR